MVSSKTTEEFKALVLARGVHFRVHLICFLLIVLMAHPECFSSSLVKSWDLPSLIISAGQDSVIASACLKD